MAGFTPSVRNLLLFLDFRGMASTVVCVCVCLWDAVLRYIIRSHTSSDIIYVVMNLVDRYMGGNWAKLSGLVIQKQVSLVLQLGLPVT